MAPILPPSHNNVRHRNTAINTAIVEKIEPWYVLGAGAMGCLWSVAMTRHLQHRMAQPVTLLLRDSSSLALYPGTVTVEHNSESDTLCRCVSMPAMSLADASIGSLKIKRLLLACKAADAEAAMISVAPLLDENAIVVVLQNGINFQQQLTKKRPAGSVFCLSTSFGAWLREPYHAVAAGHGETWLGNLYAQNTDLLSGFQQLVLAELPQMEMSINIDEDMSRRLWEKLAINCSINGLTVIYDCRNGELLSIPQAREHCEALCNEISFLMHKIPEAPAMPDLWQRVQQVALATGLNISSTLQDIRRHKGTEIEHLNGYLCELARQHHLSSPLNQQVLAAVLESSRVSTTTTNPVP